MRWRPAFEQALDPRLYPVSYLDHLLYIGQAHLWATDHAALVTEFKHFPSGAKAIAVVIAAGDKDDIVNELRPQAEAWGTTQGCTFALVESREGWGRALKPHGYATHQVALMKELG